MLTGSSSYRIKVVKIYSDIAKDLVTERLNNGAITGCGALVPDLEQKDIDQCSVITAEMGVEPYYAAMEEVPDYNVILGGQSYDPVPYFAFATSCLKRSNPQYEQDEAFWEQAEGSIMHLGKLMECGAVCADPKSAGAVGTVYADGSFDIVPTDARARCTPTSVAAHTIYEKTRPDILPGPGGWLDVTRAKYRQLEDGRTVRVSGGLFKRSVEHGKPYQIKLEGARSMGYRSTYMGSIKDRKCLK